MQPRRTGSYRHLHIEGRGLQYVHRLVAEAFVPNPACKPEVHHINHDPSDNHAANLMWVTHKENMQLAAEGGRACGKRHVRGAECYNFVLTEAVVKVIKDGREAGASVSDLAVRVGVSKTSVYRALGRVP